MTVIHGGDKQKSRDASTIKLYKMPKLARFKWLFGNRGEKKKSLWGKSFTGELTRETGKNKLHSSNFPSSFHAILWNWVRTPWPNPKSRSIVNSAHLMPKFLFSTIQTVTSAAELSHSRHFCGESIKPTCSSLSVATGGHAPFPLAE